MSSIASLSRCPTRTSSERWLMPSSTIEFICSSPATALTVCSIGRVIELFDLLRAHARIADDDADRRVGDVGQQVDRQAGERNAAQEDDDRADHEHRHGARNRYSRNAHLLLQSPAKA